MSVLYLSGNSAWEANAHWRGRLPFLTALRPPCHVGPQVVEMVKNRLSQEDAQASGWLLDGYPRSAEQAEAIEEADIRPDVFILINVRAPCALMCWHGPNKTLPF